VDYIGSLQRYEENENSADYTGSVQRYKDEANSLDYVQGLCNAIKTRQIQWTMYRVCAMIYR
jgi:hypothetical protein